MPLTKCALSRPSWTHLPPPQAHLSSTRRVSHHCRLGRVTPSLLSSKTSTMIHRSGVWRVLLLVALGVLVVFAHSERVADPSTPTRDHQDTMSGEPPSDVTTKDPFHGMTEQTFTVDFEDATHSHAMEEEEGVLGPGAITAIVIAVFLGASVLLALIVITLRKFTAS
ncbi:LOW QUALITY PROTEIN: protein SNORC [Neosynchiropus ocellatus]